MTGLSCPSSITGVCVPFSLIWMKRVSKSLAVIVVVFGGGRLAREMLEAEYMEPLIVQGKEGRMWFVKAPEEDAEARVCMGLVRMMVSLRRPF